MTDQNYDTLNKNIKYIQDKYGNNFNFINFGLNPSNIDSSGVGCYPTSEYSTSSNNMELLDTNLHSFNSCKLNAALQNKQYFALAKPGRVRRNEYLCYVSNTLQGTSANNEGSNVIVLFEMNNISNLSFDMTGNLYASGANKNVLFGNGNTNCSGGSLFSYLGIKSGIEGLRGSRKRQKAKAKAKAAAAAPVSVTPTATATSTSTANATATATSTTRVKTTAEIQQETALANAANSPYSIQKINDHKSIFTLTNNIKDQFNCDNTTNRCTGTVKYKCGSQLNYTNLSNKPPGYSISLDCNRQKWNCNYLLRLLDNGDLQIFKNNSRVWSLFQTYGGIRKTLRKYQNVISSNTEWINANLSNAKLNELSPGNELPGNGKPYLISKNSKFKLEINNGKLLLKCNTSSCLSGRNDIKYTLFNESNMSYFPYKAIPTDFFNTTYYASNTPGYNTLQKIEENNPTLQKTPEYTEYPNSYLDLDKIDPNKNSLASPEECKIKCDSDATCKSYFTMDIDSRDKVLQYCYTDSSIPIFSDFSPKNTPNPMVNSTLYVRKNTMNIPTTQNPHTLTLNPTQINTEILTINDSISGYAAYTVLPTPFNQNQILGYQGTDEYKQLVGNAQDTIYQSTSGFRTIESFVEGLDGASTVSQSGSNVSSQIDNLEKQGLHYNDLLTRTNTNYNSIQTNINNYVDISNNLNNNPKSYYSSKYTAFMPDEHDIGNQIVEDSKRLAVEQNNLWIAGSIAATTVFLTGIILNL